jgi:hypothetical protein
MEEEWLKKKDSGNVGCRFDKTSGIQMVFAGCIITEEEWDS